MSRAMDCTYMIAIAIVSVVITCVLLLHHKYKHSDPGTQPPYTWSKGEYIPDSERAMVSEEGYRELAES